jgi:hypothetical protein
MEKYGLAEPVARRRATLERKQQELERQDPQEYQFQCLLKECRHRFAKKLRAGEISFDDIQESPWPLYELDVTADQWLRLQAAVRDWVPWKTPAQKEAYDRGFRQRKRAYGAELFSTFSPEKRREHWRCWWHAERPETLRKLEHGEEPRNSRMDYLARRAAPPA